MLDRHEAPIASERLPERLGGATTRHRSRPETANRPAAERGPSSATSPAACAQICEAVTDGSLRSPSMCASVINRQRFAYPTASWASSTMWVSSRAGRAAGRRGGRAAPPCRRRTCGAAERRPRLPSARVPANGQRGAEDGFHTLLLARLHEPRGAVEAVSIGQCDGRHAELGGAARELFGRERAFLQREARPDVEMHERRVRRAGVAQRRLQGESNRCSSLGGAVAPVQTWREMRYLPDVEPLPVGFAPGAGPFGGGANWSAVLGPAG